MGTYVFGTTNIPLTYTDQELTQKVKKMVNDMPTTFTFQNLCQQILVAADKEGKLRKEPETEYSTIHLTTNDIMNISKILWEMIWERTLYIVFDAYPYCRENQSTLFTKAQ